jgi:GMP synthase-like glutamine amidotransferase
MKPILIFRFSATEGPGFFSTFLDEQHLPSQLIKIDEGDAVPSSVLDFSGLVLMGGPMSVNDELPWIEPVLTLIREANQAGLPLLGHCLGGQLISKAFGAKVTSNNVKEIGWGEVQVSANEIAQSWFGEMEVFNSFHWHGETFELPLGATHILASANCHNQAYALGKHLALQCHIEMTVPMVQSWCEHGAEELMQAAASHDPIYSGVQQADAMQQDLPLHCFFLNKVARQVYAHWIKGLQH